MHRLVFSEQKQRAMVARTCLWQDSLGQNCGGATDPLRLTFANVLDSFVYLPYCLESGKTPVRKSEQCPSIHIWLFVIMISSIKSDNFSHCSRGRGSKLKETKEIVYHLKGWKWSFSHICSAEFLLLFLDRTFLYCYSLVAYFSSSSLKELPTGIQI